MLLSFNLHAWLSISAIKTATSLQSKCLKIQLENPTFTYEFSSQPLLHTKCKEFKSLFTRKLPEFYYNGGLKITNFSMKHYPEDVDFITEYDYWWDI